MFCNFPLKFPAGLKNATKVKWSESVGLCYTDIPYGDGELNKFDLTSLPIAQRNHMAWWFTSMQVVFAEEIKKKMPACVIFRFQGLRGLQ